MERYNPKKIEEKWQKYWEEQGAFVADEKSDKPPYYILDMFPYPSGAGLHMGHIENFTATDILARYRRMKGDNVLRPMGWDAFGLPAENYAIKTGVHPAETTKAAMENFTRQITRMGLSYDWSREISTASPEYYKWTQWFFLLLYENGLAYKKKAKVNWCPSCQTVLANEQVVDGTCERCGSTVVQKDLEQWFFKITEYADELVKDLDEVDWPEHTITNQRNWIGRSEGAEIDFVIEGTDEKVRVFTTRPDTLFGATYIVLAPEHELVETLKERIENWEEVSVYIEEARNRTDMERSAEGREKTGVELKGLTAINPATKQEIPICIADYVLAYYGTGAIMAVPAHDERDFEFAQKYELPIVQVIVPHMVDESNPPQEGKKTVRRRTVQCIVKHPTEDKILGLKWREFDWQTFIIGGVEEGENIIEAAKREIREETGYTNVRFIKQLGDTIYSEYFAAHKDENRYAEVTGLYFELENEEQEEVSEEESAKHEAVWVPFAEVPSFVRGAEVHLLWGRVHEDTPYTGEGILVHSGDFDNMESGEAKRAITEQVGGEMKTTYRLRDWLVSRQRYWGCPIPIVYDPQGQAHPVPQEHLPWTLPTDVEFRPDGASPLALSKELKKRTEEIFGQGWTPEVDTMDTFVDSSWYFFRFTDSHNDEVFASKEALTKWMPVDLYMGGAEHTVLHLMYARFFTKVLQKLGYIDIGEPFAKLRHQGMILGEDNFKMSKSRGNVVNPDELVEAYGADTARLYVMFMGPLEDMKPWNSQNVSGSHRFLGRVWGLAERLEQGQEVSEEARRAEHQAIKKVTEDIEALRYNTAIAALMKYVNTLYTNSYTKEQLRTLLILLAPFAPHISEELWEQLEQEGSIHQQEWPTYEEELLHSDTVTIPVQVNGKLRAQLTVAAGTPEEELKEAALAEANVQKFLEGKEPKKIIVVPDKMVSVVV